MVFAEIVYWPSFLLVLLLGVGFSLLAKKQVKLGLLASMAPILSWSVVIQSQISANEEVLFWSLPWIPELNISIDLKLDSLTLLLLHLILGIGSLIVIYARGYFEKFEKFNRFLGLALLFMFAMSGLVISNNLLLTFVFWELTSILSFFLVAFYYDKESNRESAKRALVVTTTGALFLLAGLIMLGETVGTYQISEILSEPQLLDTPYANIIAIFIILGCLAKSAQFPFHFWLPGAMSAPTPASAFLHSATMVKAGVFLLASFSPIFTEVQSWSLILVSLGTITLFYGAFQSIFCEDLKAILAYTTIAILGALTMLIGLGTEASFKAFAILLVAHALYKATLFMIAGIIDLAKGTRNLSELGGLKKILFIPFFAAILAALSMSGIPGTLGFLAKEYKYKALIGLDPSHAWIFAMVGVISSALMMFSSFQVGFRPFIQTKSSSETKKETQPFNALRSGFLFAPPIILGLGSILLGIFPNVVSPLVSDITKSLSGNEPSAIKIWNGLNLALGLSIVTLTCGLALWLLRHKIRMFNFKPHGTETFENILKKLSGIAVQVSDYLKSSSIRSNLIIILSATVLFVWLKLWRYGTSIDLSELSIPELMPTLFSMMVILGAVLIFTTQSSFRAILYSSICGVGTSLLFLYFGAPDLAITQISVDVLLVILISAILSKLPKTIQPADKTKNLINIIFSLVVGLTFSLVIYKTLNVELSETISQQFGQWSYSLAHGANVVNVILVDFRAIDTMGEVTVLSIVALGIAALCKFKKNTKEVQS